MSPRNSSSSGMAIKKMPGLVGTCQPENIGQEIVMNQSAARWGWPRSKQQKVAKANPVSSKWNR
jgi:hypothetical protein